MIYESTTATGYANGIQPGKRATLPSTAVKNVPIMGAFQSTSIFTLASITSGQIGIITLASTVADVMPGDFVTYHLNFTAQPAGGLAYGGYRLSTAAASRLTCIVANPGSTASATLSGTITVTWFDLTP